MFSVLDVQEKKKLLEDFLRKPSGLSSNDINELLSVFPFDSTELNYLSLLVLRKRKDIVPLSEFSRRLGVSEETAEEILTAREKYALFPVASEREAKLVKALLIPIKEKKVIFVGNEITQSLELICKLTGKGFLVVFDSDFDFRRSGSYMLSLYASLVFGDRFKNMAFTGVITPEGKLEEVEFLDKKREICREKNIPLVYPSECLNDLEDFKGFITSLSLPLVILPDTDPYPFLNIFKFKEEYLRDVFHLSYPLVYTRSFKETVESFEEFANWIKDISAELKAINERHIPLRVAVTGKVLVMTFYAGVVLSKSRLAVDVYQYENENNTGTYKKAISISSDRDVPETAKVKDIIEIHERGEFKDIYIRLKTDVKGKDNSLEIKLKEGKELDENTLSVAYFINKKIRSTGKSCKRLFLDTSVPLAFALGYYLEDYICLVLMHKEKPVYTVASPERVNLYLTNAFSLNMLEKGRAVVNIEEISKDEALKLLKKGYVSYISHPSTAQVLESMLNMKIDVRREPLKLKSGDTVVVFQIKKRPSEGQIFTPEEVKSIVEEGMFTFYLVEVYY